ncbi:MAG: hypothetical protein ACOX61_03315 [Brooklawnia sp.]|jgi:fructose-specific phosphotransferase system IIC component
MTSQNQATTARKVAVIGSSGGNLYSQGGDDPQALLAEVTRQLRAAGIEVDAVQFVAAGAPMDGIRQDAPAALWALDTDGRASVVTAGTLAEVNQAAQSADEQLAARIAAGDLDGVVLVSADPSGTNRLAVEAAVAAGLPAVGTGGTSVAAAQSTGLNVVAASGTTGSTNRTRAVSYASGLARHWKLSYLPSLGSTESGEEQQGSPWRRISIRGIMVPSIPAFIAMALILAISKIPGLTEVLGPVFDALVGGIPVVVAVMAARKVSGFSEVGVVAGAVAGLLSVNGGIIGGLVGGILAGIGVYYMMSRTLRWGWPVTTANIVAGGLSGLLSGLLIFFLLAPVTAWLGVFVKDGIEFLVAFNPLLAGAIAGLVIWPAIMFGIYHSVILPLVLVEMSQKGHSFFGAVDMASLVMVSLGITLANMVRPRTTGERALAVSGGSINFFFGTFVEAAYPFMFADRKVFASALIAATIGGAVVGITGSEATAYLPAITAPFVSTNPLGFTLAMVAAAGSAFALTLLANLAATRKKAVA